MGVRKKKDEDQQVSHFNDFKQSTANNSRQEGERKAQEEQKERLEERKAIQEETGDEQPFWTTLKPVVLTTATATTISNDATIHDANAGAAAKTKRHDSGTFERAKK